MSDTDCKTCELRFKTRLLGKSQCGRRPAKRPGEESACELVKISRGPRVPKPSVRKLKRTRAKAARKRNRGAYSGQ